LITTVSRASPAYTATCKQSNGSHLMLLSMLRFTDARKRRSRNRPYLNGCALSGVVKNSAKVIFRISFL